MIWPFVSDVYILQVIKSSNVRLKVYLLYAYGGVVLLSQRALIYRAFTLVSLIACFHACIYSYIHMICHVYRWSLVGRIALLVAFPRGIAVFTSPYIQLQCLVFWVRLIRAGEVRERVMCRLRVM